MVREPAGTELPLGELLHRPTLLLRVRYFG